LIAIHYKASEKNFLSIPAQKREAENCAHMMFPHAIMLLYYTELWVNCQRRHEAKESRQAAVYGPVFVPADFLPDYYAGC